MYNNFEISLLVFMPNTTTNHAITYTIYVREHKISRFKHPNLRFIFSLSLNSLKFLEKEPNLAIQMKMIARFSNAL